MGPKVKEPVCSGCKQKGHLNPDCPKNLSSENYDGGASTKALTEVEAHLKALSLAAPGDKLLANLFRVQLGEENKVFRYVLDVKKLAPAGVQAYLQDHQRERAPVPQKKLTPRAFKAYESANFQQICEDPKCPCRPTGPPQAAPEDKDKDKDQQPEDVKAPSKRVLKRIITLLIWELEQMKKFGIATDYATQLVTTADLGTALTTRAHYVHYYDEDENVPRANAPVYRVDILPPKTLFLNDLKDYIRDSQKFPNYLLKDKDQVTTALNLIFSYRPQQYCVRGPARPPAMTNIGANKFYGLRPVTAFPVVDVPNYRSALESRPGFFRSVRVPQQGQLLLNINTTTSAFYKPLNLLDMIDRYGYRNGHGLLPFIRGIRVKTTYLRQNAGLPRGDTEVGSGIQEKIYTVTGLPFVHHEARPSNVFFDETITSGSSMSVRRTTVAEFFSRGSFSRRAPGAFN